MEPKTIEERAREYTTNTICLKHKGKKVLACEKFLQGCVSCDREKEVFEHYIAIATEQDRISRAEERSRCLNAICSTCPDIMFCVDRNCVYINNIRKAMEGGNNGN